ncbi:MAG: nucleotidyltransferase domain-containing protein [Candidatus Limnocylindrales bacterium]
MHIYAFGSVCRGEVERGSDVDLLVAIEASDGRFDPIVYSIYTYGRLRSLWAEGNPFAWHLFIESRLLFADDGIDFLRELGEPARYARRTADCEKFYQLFLAAAGVLALRRDTVVFELSTVFLAMRNLATCFSLQSGRAPVFSRRASASIGDDSLTLDERSYEVLENARLLCTRGYGTRPSEDDIVHVVSRLDEIEEWMKSLIAKVRVE